MQQKEYFMGLGIVGTGVFLVLLIIVVVAALAFFTGDNPLAFTCEDQSREKLNNCNIDCGEGVLSSICKSSCTIEHNNRLEVCAKN